MYFARGFPHAIRNYSGFTNRYNNRKTGLLSKVNGQLALCFQEVAALGRIAWLLFEERLLQHNVNAFGAVYDLGDAKIGGEAA
jgi:hypothetical protein